MKKKLTLCILFSILCMLLCSCGGQSEKAIIEDIPASVEIFIDKEIITLSRKSATVELRREDEVNRSEEVQCVATFVDADYELKLHYKLIYLYYDKGGWILQRIETLHEDAVLAPRYAIPENVLTHLMDGYAIGNLVENSYDGEFYYYNTYNTEGTVSMYDDYAGSIEAAYGGTVTFRGELYQRSWGEYEWYCDISDVQLSLTDHAVSQDYATAYARRYYPSATYISDTFEDGIHTFSFSVNEDRRNCTSTGTFSLDFKVTYYDSKDPIDSYGPPLLNGIPDHQDVDILWKFFGNWSCPVMHEVVYRGEHLYNEICRLDMTISDMTNTQIILSDAFVEGYSPYEYTYFAREYDCMYELRYGGCAYSTEPSLVMGIGFENGKYINVWFTPDQAVAEWFYFFDDATEEDYYYLVRPD